MNNSTSAGATRLIEGLVALATNVGREGKNVLKEELENLLGVSGAALADEITALKEEVRHLRQKVTFLEEKLFTLEETR